MEYTNPWMYQGRPFTDDDIGDNKAFVYRIVNKVNGFFYIGKKNLQRVKTRQVKGKKKKSLVASDWPTYYGSSEILKAEVERVGPENFSREILHLCKTKGDASYLEAKEQFACDALLRNDSYNAWLSVRIRKSHLKLKVPE